MGTRFIDTSRDPRKRSAASEFMRLEIQKKGKLPANLRYKLILKKKLAENQGKASKGGGAFSLPGAKPAAGTGRSKRAEQALKDMAAKKAAKEAKKLRQMVVVQPRNFNNGQLNKRGQIFDVAGNMIGQVNTKNGAMTTNGGWSIGKYKPKSFMTDMLIQDAINKYSPYFINLRKMQSMQQGENYNVWGDTGSQDTINVYANNSMAMHGYGAGGAGVPAGLTMDMHGRYIDMQGRFVDAGGHHVEEAPAYGVHMAGPRQNIGTTAWGAMSDNVWGSYADNAWGVSSDNVWGGNSSDIWGGIGGNPWGNHAKTVRIWGSGNGHNYLKPLINSLKALFGLSIRPAGSRRESMLQALSNVRQRHSSGSRGSTAPRHSPAPRAPTGRR